MDNQRQYGIVFGPSDKHAFVEAFEHAYDTGAATAKDITFTVAYNPETKGPHEPGNPYAQMYVVIRRITGISYEDGSGAKFNLAGFAETEERLAPSAPKAYNFTAYYDVNRRKGQITIS